MKVRKKRRAEFYASIILSLFFIALNSAAAILFATYVGIGGLR